MIWDMITGLLPDVAGYVAAAGLALLGALWVYFKGRSDAKAKSDGAALKKTVQGAEAARKGRAEAISDLAKGKTPEEIRRQNDGKW